MDAPSCEEAREYECIVLDETSEEDVHLHEQLTILKTTLDQESAAAVLPGRIRKPVWASSPSASVASIPGAAPAADEIERKREEERKKEEEKAKREMEKKTETRGVQKTAAKVRPTLG